MLKDYGTFQDELVRLSTLEPKSQHAKARLRSVELYHALNHELNFGNLASGAESISRIRTFLADFDQAVNSGIKVNFRYNCAVFNFMHGESGEAVADLNALLDMSKGELRSDIRQFAHILLMIIHFDLDNLSLIDYMHRNTYRRFKQQNDLLWYEADLLSFLKKGWKEAEPSEFRKVCDALKNRLEEQQKNSSHRRPTGLQEVLYWLDSKVKNQPLADYYQEIIAVNRQAL